MKHFRNWWAKPHPSLPIIYVVAATTLVATFVPAAPTRDDWIRGARDRTAQLQKETVIAEALADKALESNNVANQEVGRLKAENAQLVKGANDERQAKLDAWKEVDKLRVQNAHLTKKLHLAKWIFSGLVTATIVFLLLWLKIPPPFLWYIGGAVLVGANTFIWIWL